MKIMSQKSAIFLIIIDIAPNRGYNKARKSGDPLPTTSPLNKYTTPCEAVTMIITASTGKIKEENHEFARNV